MKTHHFKFGLAFLTLMAVAITFSGCNLFDKADDITFTDEFVVNTDVEENDERTDVVYSSASTIKLEDHEEVKKYINKIKEIKVEKISYRVENYEGDDVVYFKNGAATFVTSSSSFVSVPFTVSTSGVNLKTSTTDTALDVDTDALNDLANTLKSTKELTMTSTGVLSSTPVACRVITTIKVKITAEVLD